jgi:hypothetical protein
MTKLARKLQFWRRVAEEMAKDARTAHIQILPRRCSRQRDSAVAVTAEM